MKRLKLVRCGYEKEPVIDEQPLQFDHARLPAVAVWNDMVNTS